MKKLIFGLTWQILGFLGAIIILCSAAPHQWDYNGITGIVGSLLGLRESRKNRLSLFYTYVQNKATTHDETKRENLRGSDRRI